MKELLKRLKTAYQVLIGKVRFDQRTTSIQDIDKRLEKLLSKYTNDKYRSVKIEYEVDSNNEVKIRYGLYSSYGVTSNHVTSLSGYPTNLEDAFKVMEDKLKTKANPVEKKETEKLTIEI